jgi:hypothetical protein
MQRAVGAGAAALEWATPPERFYAEHLAMKRLLALAAACSLVLLCAACAQGGPAPSSGASGITMYGTIDEGITVRR